MKLWIPPPRMKAAEPNHYGAFLDRSHRKVSPTHRFPLSKGAYGYRTLSCCCCWNRCNARHMRHVMFTFHTYYTYIYIYIHTYKHTGIQTYRHTDIQAYRHTYIQTYRHTDIQTDRETDRQTYIHTYMHTYIHNIYIYIYVCVSHLKRCKTSKFRRGQWPTHESTANEATHELGGYRH